jgi:DNA modification methylase
MANPRPIPRPIRPAAGFKTALQEKSRKRRLTQKTLASTERHESPRRNDLLPTLRLEYLPIDALRPADRRVRQTAASQIAKVELSLRQFGVCAPVLIDSDGRIVHGHVVWEAARRLGLEKMPVVRIDHLTTPERRALSIALNRLGETGEWDVEALTIEFEELIELNEDIVTTGFDLAEVDALLLEDDSDAPEAEEVPPLPESQVSQPGDLWVMGEHRLLQGDARDRDVYARLVGPSEGVRLVLTDVPFNVPIRGHCTGQKHHREFAIAHGELSREEFDAFNKDWMRLASGVLIDGGLLATFIDWRSVELILAAGRELGLDLLNVVIWAKSNAGQGSLWRSQHEMLPVFKKGSAPHVNNIELGRWGRYRSNVWTYPGASTLGSDAREGLAVHPTVKPRAMLEDALLDVTERGDAVLDCFLGSGSTLLAAEATGRVGRAIEIDGRYCDVAMARWQQMTGREAILEETGETHAEVARRRSAAFQRDGDR